MTWLAFALEAAAELAILAGFLFMVIVWGMAL